MSRTIFCVYLQCNAEGLTSAPYPGALGKRIYQEISQQAWSAWQKQQTRLINENHLNMMCVAHRTWLEEQMNQFLFPDHCDKSAIDNVLAPTS